MRLHCDVRVQMVKCAIGLFASVPTTFVHALNFFISSTRSFVLLRTRNGNERVHSRERMSALYASSVKALMCTQANKLLEKTQNTTLVFETSVLGRVQSL